MSALKRTLLALSVWALMLVTLSMWSLSSPVGSSPDDDFHLASIWCGNGLRDGLCEAGEDDTSRMIPREAGDSPCFAFKVGVSGACQGEKFQQEGITLKESSRVNSGSQYPSGFYFWSSFLAGDNIAVSTVWIRILHSAIFSTLVVLTWCLLPRRFRFSLAASTALTIVPLGLFLVASTNPSSWAITSGAILFPALLGFFATKGRRRIGLGVIAVVAALLGLGSRGDSAAYVIIAACAAVVLSFRTTRRFLLLAALPLVIVIAAAFAFLTAGQTGLALEGMGPSAGTAPTSVLLMNNLLAIPSLWSGVFGLNWGLGWLDTMMPGLVWGTTMFLFSGALFASFRWQGWRKPVALAGIGLALIVVPVYILVTSGALVGSEVQPRYILPLVTLFLAAALAPSVGKPAAAHIGTRLSDTQLWVIAVGLAGAQSIALFYNLRRYVSPGAIRIDHNIQWWWEAGPSPMATWALGTVAFAGALVAFVLATLRTQREDVEFSPAVVRPEPTRTVAPASAAQPAAPTERTPAEPAVST